MNNSRLLQEIGIKDSKIYSCFDEKKQTIQSISDEFNRDHDTNHDQRIELNIKTDTVQRSAKVTLTAPSQTVDQER